MPNLIYKLKIEILTNGFTKYLRLSDIDDNLDFIQRQSYFNTGR